MYGTLELQLLNADTRRFCTVGLLQDYNRPELGSTLGDYEETLMEGGCTCGHIRYRLEGAPIIVHACHCRWCQRETGTAHALNAVYEAERVMHTAAEPEIIHTPSASGKGQEIARCPKCKIAVWSNYSGSGPLSRFVRVGTLDNPDLMPPDIHIYTSTKQPWVMLPPDAKSFPQFYNREEVWTPAARERWQTMLEKRAKE